MTTVPDTGPDNLIACGGSSSRSRIGWVLQTLLWIRNEGLIFRAAIVGSYDGTVAARARYRAAPVTVRSTERVPYGPQGASGHVWNVL